MKNKHTYRPLPVESFSVEPLLAAIKASGQAVCVVAIDMAKTQLYAAFATVSGHLHGVVTFRQPQQTALFFALLDPLRQASIRVEIVLESTGTYGDPLRQLCSDRQIPVFRVAAKHAKDAAELFDGVPSQHDAKDAAVLAWLHSQKKSRPWPVANDTTRIMRALCEQHQLFANRFEHLVESTKPSWHVTDPAYWPWQTEGGSFSHSRQCGAHTTKERPN